MKYKDSVTIVGYSGFILFEQCYEYNENACYITDSYESAKEFMEDNCGSSNDYRIDKISFGDIMKDYGCSCGEYAMESGAFSIFKEIAVRNNVRYKAEKWDIDPSLTVVEIEDINKGPNCKHDE
ncbi:MAG: hypothetical protein L6420_08310 [Elusimicrobia bacterium]|nr:hypothetical protein [Candidatus Omnitrophota bacterium]MCG2726235.1 hypothetical protein [Elusimicrobiota bacterium]